MSQEIRVNEDGEKVIVLNIDESETQLIQNVEFDYRLSLLEMGLV